MINRFLRRVEKENPFMRPNKQLVKTFLLPLFCLLTMLLTACGGSTTSPGTASTTKADASKQIFVITVGGARDFKSVDPAISPDAGAITAINMVFTGLVQLNDKL